MELTEKMQATLTTIAACDPVGSAILQTFFDAKDLDISQYKLVGEFKIEKLKDKELKKD